MSKNALYVVGGSAVALVGINFLVHAVLAHLAINAVCVAGGYLVRAYQK